MQLTKTKNGFTLIELLVAMTIMAVLSGIILTSFIGARKASRDAKRKADMEQIRSALEMYRADTGEYPDIADLSGGIVSGAKIYLKAPVDPDSTNKIYYYQRLTTSTYRLCTVLEIADTNLKYCADDCNLTTAPISCGAAISCNCGKLQP